MDTFLKRICGFAAGAVGLVALAPVLLLVALLVRLVLGRPVLFRQKRIGYLGRTFELVKFRTMSDARDASGELLPDTMRLGRFGRFLRATSLDELPQLWNVLKGDMTLVGPRPLLEAYRPLYSPEQFHRHDVLPGITGWAQVHGRNGISWNERLECDLWYVKHHSPLVDLGILARTLASVASGSHVNREGGTIIAPPDAPAAGAGAAGEPASAAAAGGRVAVGRFLLRLAGDAALLFLALLAAFELRFEFAFFSDSAQAPVFFGLHVPVVVGVQFAALLLCGAERGLWRFFGIADLGRFLVAGCLSGVALAAWRAFAANGYPRAVPWSVLVLDSLFAFWLPVGVRVLRRAAFAAAKDRERRAAGAPAAGAAVRVLVAGAGYKGIELVRRFSAGGVRAPVGFLDDDPAKWGLTVAGVEVLGSLADAGRVAWARNAAEIVLAFDAPEAAAARVRAACAASGARCAVKTWADFASSADGASGPGLLLRADPATGRLRVSAGTGAPEAAAALAAAVQRVLDDPAAAGAAERISALFRSASGPA